MEKTEVLARLPVLHAVALRLKEAGADDHVIATAVGLEDDQVGPLLRVAESKFARLSERPAD